MKKLVLSACLIAATSVNAIADDDTFVKIQEMVNDLGGPQMQKKNNGKTLKCATSGTKKITISSKDGGTNYHGVYNNCNEYGRQRSGDVIITTGGGDVEAQSSSLDKLFGAINNDDISLIKKLASKKVVNLTIIATDVNGGAQTSNWTPLMAAAQGGKLEAVKALVKAGAKVDSINSNNVNAFWLAVSSNRTETALFLAKSGADVNVVHTTGSTAFLSAAYNGNEQLLDFLLKQKNVKLDARYMESTRGGVNALYFAITREHYAIAHKLLSAGINVNCVNPEGWTPLMVAIAKQQPELAKAIRAKNPDLTVKNDDGETADDVMTRVNKSASVAK